MSIRKIKNAKDLSTNELIYFKSHAQATFMNNGLNVEEAITNLENSQNSTKEEFFENIAEKQDIISDLDAIREGAAKGATALQEIDYNQLQDNLIDSGFLHTTDGMIHIDDLDESVITFLEKADTALQSIPSEYITETELANKGYVTTSDLNNKVDKVTGKQLSTEDFTTALKTKLEGLSNYDDTDVMQDLDGLRDQIENVERDVYDTSNDVRNLHEVARSGSYNDLSDKPTIPAAVTESTVSGWGFTKNTGTYSKPSSGIPKSDLASAVQTSLGKADTALQSYTEQYKGTITGVSANGTSVATSGVANIPAASTSKYGVTKLNSSTSSTSTTEAATPSAVKSAYDLANSYKGTVTGVKVNGTTKSPSNGVVDLGTVITSHQDISGKQDKLVSGTNIKTINGTSLLGSGNIVISGGGGSSSGSGAYAEVNHGTSDTTFTLTPNTFHVWEEVSALTLTLGSETAGVANEYLFQFNSGATATSLTLPDDIKWTEELVIEPNMIYQVSILKGLASVLSWDNAVKIQCIAFTINGTSYVAENEMTWSAWCSSEYNTSDWRVSYNIVRTIGDSLGYYVISNVTPSDIITDGVSYSSYFYSLDIP